ncbi:hypothetical protein R1flu_026263 [Riccia fluitans]|uniref:Uncharacterized protein n=1 Tax=Riccia fluitans TaxID=41844 RepID=A0ABD1XFY8_9MARC
MIFLNDIEKGEDDLSKDVEDMPLRHRYATGATMDREDTLQPIHMDEIGDDDTLDTSLLRLILNQPYNILRDHSLAKLYKHYCTSKRTYPNEKQHKKEWKDDAEVEVLDRNMKHEGKIDTLLGMNIADLLASSSPKAPIMLVETAIRRILRQLKDINYKSQLDLEPADDDVIG